jgi:hypothetical protein
VPAHCDIGCNPGGFARQVSDLRGQAASSQKQLSQSAERLECASQEQLLRCNVLKDASDFASAVITS